MPFAIKPFFADSSRSIANQFGPWSTREVAIKDVGGKIIFSQNVRAPESWSNQAVTVVAQKYLYGDKDHGDDPIKGGRENSVDQLAYRVAIAISDWAAEDGYFDFTNAGIFLDEIHALILSQSGSFNSPVWFNVGLSQVYGIKGTASGYRYQAKQRVKDGDFYPAIDEVDDSRMYPQTSACFIQSVDDNMASIMNLAASEAMLFKYGSGTGTDLSTIRSSKEKLSGGGKPSGPVSFMEIYDAIAGVIKSGGTTRRAAKMQTLSCVHPDILAFVDCKIKEDRKARALVAAGFSGGMEGDAGTVKFQNANLSVRPNDEFMRKCQLDPADPDSFYDTIAVTTGRPVEQLSAAAVIHKIAENAWECGDPGLQYGDTINHWHMIPKRGRINSSNPCSEYLSIDDSACNLASLNLMRFRADDGAFDVDRFCKAVRIFIIAQDSLIDHSSFPTRVIAENAHKHRELGLGYCGLGAYLMTEGLPYDSDEGRSLAGAITAIMTAQAYLTSSENAKLLGTFTDYEENEDNVQRIMREHRELCYTAHTDSCVSDSDDSAYLWSRACGLWDKVVDHVAAHGLRNSQTTVLAPTGCTVAGSLILTDRGLVRLGSLGNVNGDRWQDVSFRVQTDRGPRPATKFFINGESHVVELRTNRGYQFDATPEHRIKTVTRDGEWRWSRMADIAEGDWVPMQMGGMIGDPVGVSLIPHAYKFDGRTTPISFPAKMTMNLAELIGTFQANGSLHTKGLRVSINSHDSALIIRTRDLFSACFGIASVATPSLDEDEVSVVVNSVPLTRWWDSNGFSKVRPDGHVGKGLTSRVPDAIIATNDPLIYAAFIRGYADHDGTISEGCPEVLNKDRNFVRDLKSILLAIGIPTGLRSTISGKSGRPLWRARILNRSYGSRWNELIGFTEDRKRDAVVTANDGKYDMIPVSSEILDRVCPYGHQSRRGAIVSVRRFNAITRRMAIRLYRESDDGDLGRLLGFFYDRISSSILSSGMRPTYDISVPDNVTYIANGFVSHNTISFMMESDHSSGVEPCLAVKVYKTLAGGGMIEVINPDIRQALVKLGYQDGSCRDSDGGSIYDEVGPILVHVEANGTVEGAPHLKAEHLAVFDCALPSRGSGRSIAPMGHVKMVASVQRFLSGAVSKTVNLPNSATVEDIKNIYIEAWKLGVKAVAVYRDGSKTTQPVKTTKDLSPGEPRIIAPVDPDGNRQAMTIPESSASLSGALATIAAHVGCVEAPGDFRPTAELLDEISGRVCMLTQKTNRREPTRDRLPDTRKAITHKGTIDGQEFFLTIGEYPDGRPGETFMMMSKEGSLTGGMMDAFGTALSLLLQYGVPVEILVAKFTNGRFPPMGFTKNPQVPIVSSVVDYVMKFIDLHYGSGRLVGIPALVANAKAHFPEPKPPKQVHICANCGNGMNPLGPHCWQCPNCREQIGGCG